MIDLIEFFGYPSLSNSAFTMKENQSEIVVVVRRVTLPQYEMQCPQGKVALEHVQSIKEKNTFAIPVGFIEPAGQELVFDLSRKSHQGAKDVPLSVTLLFRIIKTTNRDNSPLSDVDRDQIFF